MSELRRMVAGIFLFGVGLVGLGMTLCGGVFTVAGLWSLFTPRHGEDYSSAFLVFSLPSLVVGLLIVRAVWRRWSRAERP